MSDSPKKPEQMSAWERWEMASFDPAPPPAPPKEPEAPPPPPEPEFKLPTAEEIEQIYQQARDEGYQVGLNEGHQAALPEAARIAALAQQLEASLAAMDEQVAEELLNLSLEVARQVVREAVRLQPESILTVIREALLQLPHQHAAIYLNPEDAALVRSQMGDQLEHAGHRIHDDVRLPRGDCLVDAGNTNVDATVANRWRRVVAALGSDVELKPLTHESRASDT
ncbi:MAG TPA: flagellar assembly protein FliH [Rhodocyclaceae bacterium]|jgi:flagellar assembly protein FliH|nr:flagellar assembly protein FliH [Rhodocyclaceae bacterium]